MSFKYKIITLIPEGNKVDTYSTINIVGTRGCIPRNPQINDYNVFLEDVKVQGIGIVTAFTHSGIATNIPAWVTTDVNAYVLE